MSESTNNHEEAKEAGFSPEQPRGIVVMQGQTLTFPAGSIVFTFDGSEVPNLPPPLLGTHMAPYWLSAAVSHGISAQVLSHETNAAWKAEDESQQSETLETELIASMQAITSSAFALDALHAALLKVSPTPETTRMAWRKNKTRRSRQMFETLRRCFRLTEDNRRGIRQFFDAIFEYRDAAVHPPSSDQPVTCHPRLLIGLDPAFARFRARNAVIVVGHTVAIIGSASKSEKVTTEAVRQSMTSLRERVEPVVEAWERSAAGAEFARLVSRFS